MNTTVDEITRWFNNGIRTGSIGMIVLRNKATLDEYPVYVRTDQDIRDQVRGYQRSYGDEVLEVYDLKKPLDKQLAEERAMNY